MIDSLRRSTIRALRIPPPPEPPSGTVESTRTFRAARGFFFRRVIEWALAQGGALAGLAFGWGFTLDDFVPDSLVELGDGYVNWNWLRALELASMGLFALQFVLSLFLIWLQYELRWYIVTDRSLRIREGIFTVREQTVSFANIQNVSVKQGPLQRLLRIADLEIRTAGGGGSSDSDDSDHLHRAVFRGIDNAEEVRDLIRRDLQRLRRDRDEPPQPEPDSVTPIQAAERLADTAADLRRALARG